MAINHKVLALKEADVIDRLPAIPAERVAPGIAVQRVNIFHPVTGEFVRQVRYPGTERQARAYGLLQIVHDTDPLFPYLLRVLRGEE